MPTFLYQTLPYRLPADPPGASGDPPAPPPATVPTGGAAGAGTGAMDPTPAPEAGKTLLDEAKTEEKAPVTPSEPLKEADLKIPEGFELNPEQGKAFTEMANKYHLSKEAAQEVFDFGIKALKASDEAGMKLWTDTQAAWTKETLADKDLGDTTGLKPEVKASIGKMLDTYGGADSGKALRDAFNITGAGNNPQVVKFLYNVSKALTEGGNVHGQPRGQRTTPPDIATAMWPDLATQQ